MGRYLAEKLTLLPRYCYPEYTLLWSLLKYFLQCVEISFASSSAIDTTSWQQWHDLFTRGWYKQQMFFRKTAFLLNFNRKGRINVGERTEGGSLEHVESHQRQRREWLIVSFDFFLYVRKDLQIVYGPQCGRLYMAYYSVP